MKYVFTILSVLLLSGCYSFTDDVDSKDMGKSNVHGWFDQESPAEPIDYNTAAKECIAENPELKWAQNQLEACVYDKTGIISVKQGQKR